jgi:BirA family biotin operon repressor/biotin-[acetyl-CoA-carboxylase] ligase
MDQAAALARCGAPDRSVVVSAEQTAGRGRGGRSWQAPPGSGIFCTLILRPHIPPARLSTLPLLAGVAVAEAVERLTGHAARLKWPNDIWLGDDPARQKVAGILATSRLSGARVDHALIGIGINLTARLEDLPPGATSVREATGIDVTSEAALGVLLERFDRQYTLYVTSEGVPSLDSWRKRAALVGEPVRVVEDGAEVSGVFAGIDGNGALLLAMPEGEVRSFVAGELVRGPLGLSPLSPRTGRGGQGG